MANKIVSMAAMGCRAMADRARETLAAVEGLVAYDCGASSPPDWRPFVADLAKVVAELAGKLAQRFDQDVRQ